MSDEQANVEDAYELAETTFLDLVRAAATREAVGKAAGVVATAAATWNAAAYASFHAADPHTRADLNDLTERTEVLSELWADIAAAYATGHDD